MASTLEETAERVRKRVHELRRIRARRLKTALTLVSLLLITGIERQMDIFNHQGVATVPGGYGAVIIRHGASGYVTAGTIAFIAGVLFTLLMIRIRDNERKKKRREKRDGDKIT